MAQPTLSNARHDPLLSNFLIKMTNDRRSYVHGTMFPTIPVRQPAGAFKKVKQGEMFRDRVTERPMGARPRQVGFEFEDDNYAVVEEALETMLDDRERSNQSSPPIQLEKIKIGQVMEEHLIHLDRKWVAEYFVTGKWTTDVDGTSIVRWDSSSSVPIKDVRGWIRDMQKLTGKRANRLALGADIFDVLMDHADIIARISGAGSRSDPAIADMELLRQIFFPEDPAARVVVADAIYNSADSGISDSMDFIADSKALLLSYADPVPAIGVATAGATFSWTGLLGSNATPTRGVAPGVWRGRDDRAHSDWFQVRVATDFQIVSADLGTFAYEVIS